ncbi:DNA-binding bromodomain-containing protein [Actinidia rufa]|uniref:DNA-binding bromodomain-containing protein n=1 Tax=Actinidia rufa TaxID=165716 RepID=A0A7J0ESJ0_9ERIC|nr:DNA-binding bromodomain-containing protein [Actinidia rufa]
MKRKRGNKKGKSKKPNVVVVNEPTQNVISVNTEDNSGSGDIDKDEIESGMEVATLPSTATGADQPRNFQCEQTHQKELSLLCRDPRYNEQELRASLEVVKKIMKMDAAEPFNAPVNPIALGIPDYFEVIDTPMDFGTICNNLETGVHYMNSEDVFKDVQYIWENCYKYNNKGDYVVELMKRVKKNFMKYWTAAGLHTEPAQGISGDGFVLFLDYCKLLC